MSEVITKTMLFYYSGIVTCLLLFFMIDYKRLYVRKCNDIQRLLKTIGELRDGK